MHYKLYYVTGVKANEESGLSMLREHSQGLERP